jgi:HEAT repeat protein
MAVNGDRLIDSFRVEPRSLSGTLASIQRLVTLQARAARGASEADQAYVAAFADSDAEVKQWALSTSFRQIKAPSLALGDALLAHWRNDTGLVPKPWPHDAGLVANAVVTWRLRRAASLFAETLKTSRDGDRRAFAAMALGGTGDLAYLPLLREVASRDANAQARALAYNGIMHMLGPDSLGDLRRGANDADVQVRVRAISDSYNLLELGRPERRWPPVSSALIAEVRAFLSEMQRDPDRRVSDNAKSTLRMIGRQRERQP